MKQSETRNWSDSANGDMRMRIYAHDWSASELGHISRWPQCLKSSVNLLLALSAPAMLLWGRGGVAIYNNAWRRLVGDAHAGTLGARIGQTAAWLADLHAQAHATVMDGGDLAYRDQEFLLQRDGHAERIWLNLDYSLVPDDSGHAAGVFALITETTAKVVVERRLAESEARLSAIFARAPVGLSELSESGRFLRVNDALCRMLKRDPPALLALGVPDVTHPADLPPSLEALGRLLRNGEPVWLDKRYLNREGEIVWARSNLSLLEHGSERTILAVTVDLTASKLAAQALAESEARFRTLAEASPALIWSLDPQGRILYLNPRYLAVTGKSANELCANWAAILHPDDADAYLGAIARAQQARTPMTQCARVRTAADGWRWLQTHAAPWYASDGSYAGHVGISIDITDEISFQQELIISNERLKLAIEGSGDGIWDWAIQERKVVYSDRLKEMLGFDRNDLFDSEGIWRKRVHPDDLPEALDALAACLSGKTKTFRNEHRILCKNGDWKWVMARAIVVARDTRNAPLRMTGTITDISEKRQSEEVIWRHANFDALTGLPNRRLFRDRLDHEVRKARRNGLPMALLFIDLDRFKEANDLLGHDVGDQLLAEAAKRIAGCVRASDTVARLGGDEFTAILAELDDLAHVESIAQKIIITLAEPFRLCNEVVYLSASVGITLYPSDASTPEDLIRNADQAMYAAKNGGRNQFSYFTSSMQQQANMRLRLIGDLRHALADDQLRVYYQPVIDLATGKVAKAEALLRWMHPRLGMIEPPRFIPFAEESGLINEIGEWVFRQAASSSRAWSEHLGRPFQISVNKSPVQFQSRGRDSNWVRYLNEQGLPGSSISVEITEGLLLNASPVIAEQLLQYRDAGIQVAIDDFGTGYSSMAYLRKFDIDYLKIDRSFIRDITIDSGDHAIVRSIIAMAHELGLQVIAEGIETDAQKLSLQAAGCDFGQGFLFSQAVPADEFARALQR